MDVFQALLLGLIQGLTEFIPVSSSGHLVVIPEIFGWPEHSLAFDTVLHLGTALALIIYFRRDLWNIFISGTHDLFSFRDSFSKYSDNGKQLIFIIVGSIPAGLLGLAVGDLIEEKFRSGVYVALFMPLGTLLMLAADMYSKKINKDAAPTLPKSLIIGLFQSLALFSGFSRSGATISGGLLLGFTREKAARFSFLLSVPIVVLAAVLSIYKNYSSVFSANNLLPEAVGLVVSAVSGFLAIKFLLNFLKNNSLKTFIVYRLMLVCIILIFWLF